MAEYIANLTNGQMDEKGFHRFFGVLLNQSGVIQTGSMVVAAQGTPDMTVRVAGGATGHDIVFITTAGDTYHGWNTASKNVTITANSSGVIKTDAIVAYADLASGIATSNNPGALKYVAVRRGSTSTGNPTSGEIETAVSSNPYVVLAYVTVANGASSINSGNITNARVTASLANSSLLSAIYPIGSVYTNAAVATNPGTLLGFGTWAAFGAGRVLVGVDAGQTEFDTLGETGGAKTHTLLTSEMPSHRHSLTTKTGTTGSVNQVAGQTNTGGATQTAESTVVGLTGGDGSHNNLQPYITVYMWRRTA